MKRFLIFLLVLIASVWLGLHIAKDPGLAFFSYRDWSVEMPLWFAVLSFIFLLITLYLLLRMVDGIQNFIHRCKNWLHRRKKQKAYSKTHRGLLELIEGQWKNAEHDLLGGLSQSEAPLINYLALAKAANEQSNLEKRDNYLRKAHACAPQADLPIGLTQAQLQLQQGQWEQALATLKHLRTIAPHHVLVLTLLERAYTHLGDWKGLLELLPSLYKTAIIERSGLYTLETRAYQALLTSFESHHAHLSAMRHFWETVPRKIQQNPVIVVDYLKQLLKHPDTSSEAEGLAYKTLKHTWNNELAHLYGNIPNLDPNLLLSHAEKLLKRYPNQPILLLTLGRLATHSHLWGKARRYYEESLTFAASSETFFEYGKLLEQLGNTRAAMESYRDGLQLTLTPQH